jgi:hypothetical protein
VHWQGTQATDFLTGIRDAMTALSGLWEKTLDFFAIHGKGLPALRGRAQQA